MTADSVQFANFTFDPGERILIRDGERIDLSGRYFDALALLLRERGRLVTKDRFMDEVWRGVPVTDEALTQCIRTLRRRLGDDAARPRFIETVPRHGYRFIAETDVAHIAAPPPRRFGADLHFVLRSAGVAALGGAIAGVGGGLFYGFAASPRSPADAIGAISVLLVLLTVNMAIGLIGGLGVGGGIGASRLVPGDKWQASVAGGMAGGLVIGAVAKLLGLDAFALLVGSAPMGMTGAAEGALLGAAIGLASWFARDRGLTVGHGATLGGAAGAGAGLLVPLLGGHLLGGSLNLLARGFPDARFRLDAIGALVGESGFGPRSEAATAAVEGALFGLCVVGALALAGRLASGRRDPC